ncbi:MAG: NifU family protein [Rickettsiaceae bacterium]|nr:NifU family protein [Rickettsiaceae bacterium]
MYIQVETTPNDAALKFLLGITVSIPPIFFEDSSQTVNKSKLAERLFTLTGVKAVFFGNDFITITKQDGNDWALLKPEIISIITEYLVTGLPILEDIEKADTTKLNDADLSDIDKQIIEIIETRVRPAVARDGGDITYQAFDQESGKVYLQLKGACSGCPSAAITLKDGIESMLQHYVPEVIEVVAVEDEK